MKLTADQLAQYDRDGFLVFPNLIAADEVALLKRELARVGDVEDERVVRERTGGVRMVYGVHEETGPTASAAYNALVRSPRILQPIRDILGEDAYVFHTKANTKQAIDGAIYEWHQDYANWNIMDGIPTHQILTAMVMLDKSTEIGGCLYFVPGSHKLGIIKPDVPADEIDAAIRRVVERGEPMAVPKDKMVELVTTLGEPVAITGEAGTVAFFHGDMVHGSGHNMSIHSRWILYIVYAAVSNQPQAVPKPRAEYKAARHAGPMRMLEAGSILESL
jgi:ectoine hydroxylase